MVKTYNSKKIIVTFGAHMVSGFAEDSFVEVAPAGDGVTMKQGCDGEIVRSVSPNNTYKVKLDLLPYSPTVAWLQNMYNKDQQDGSGMFPISIKDLTGGMLFNSSDAWVTLPATRGFGKEASNRTWEIQTAGGDLTE